MLLQTILYLWTDALSVEAMASLRVPNVTARVSPMSALRLPHAVEVTSLACGDEKKSHHRSPGHRNLQLLPNPRRRPRPLVNAAGYSGMRLP